MADVTPYHDRDGFIWYDGKLVPWREANLHVLSHGLHYASAVFEGERAYGGVIFELTQHSQRLSDGAKTMDFQIPYSVAEIGRACQEVVKANKLTDCYVRPIAWRGSEMMGVSAQTTKIHLAVATWDWGSYFPMEQRLKGIRLTIAQYRRPDPATAPAKTKAAGLYMICTLDTYRAERMGYADALMYDWRGRVAECTGANIFFVKDGALHTPTPDCFLDGITRRTVIGLANRGVQAGRSRRWLCPRSSPTSRSASWSAPPPRSRPCPRSASTPTSPASCPRRSSTTTAPPCSPRRWRRSSHRHRCRGQTRSVWPRFHILATSNRPYRRVCAERHRRPHPHDRRFGEHGGMLDEGQAALRRIHLVQQIGHVIVLGIGTG